MQRLASGDEPDPDLEPVVTDTADVALAEVRGPFAKMPLARLVGVRHGDRSGRLGLDVSRARFGHDGLTVAEQDVAVDLLHQ